MNIIKLFCFCMIIVCGFFSCLDSSDKSTIKSTQADTVITVSPKHKPTASFNDTMTIGFSAAVFYNPDSLQLINIKKITDSAIFESMEHDCFFQQRYARIILKKYYPKIKIVEFTKGRYIVFLKAGGQSTCIDLDTKPDPCGIFIFDGNKEPMLTDMTNIETDLGQYFEKKNIP